MNGAFHHRAQVVADDIGTVECHDEELNYYAQEEAIFQAQVVSDDIASSLTKIPQAEATLVEPLLSTPREQTLTPLTVPAVPIGMRPEFCYAQAWLSSSSSSSCSNNSDHGGNDAGIFLRSRPNFGVTIAGLTATSPLHGSNICPDDHIIAVNGLSCADADLSRVEKLIAASKHSISIVVHNKGGIPYLVSSSVQKQDPSSKVGIFLKNRQGVVRINKVSKDGLFGQSLLMPQHRCIRINGLPCHVMNARRVGNAIAQATNRVTIVSQPQIPPSTSRAATSAECYAVTIASYEHHRRWWKKIAVGTGVAAGAAAVMVLSIS